MQLTILAISVVIFLCVVAYSLLRDGGDEEHVACGETVNMDEVIIVASGDSIKRLLEGEKYPADCLKDISTKLDTANKLLVAILAKQDPFECNISAVTADIAKNTDVKELLEKIEKGVRGI